MSKKVGLPSLTVVNSEPAVSMGCKHLYSEGQSPGVPRNVYDIYA